MDIQLSTCQDNAVNDFQQFLVDDSKHFIISGFAGSGKTFLVKYLADLVEDQLTLQGLIDTQFIKPDVYFTATTHKAAEVLSGFLQKPAQTIHSLLGLVVHKDGNGGYRLEVKSRPRPLKDSVIFIDESSMIGNQLMHYIRKAVNDYENCKFVFIGDPYQLPPVKENICPIFKEKLGTSHHFLNEIQRQAAHNPIIQYSAQYRKVLDDASLPWPQVPHDGQHIFYYPDRASFQQEIANTLGVPHDPYQKKILAYQNSTVRHYNKWIRSLHGHTDDFTLGEIVMTNKPIMTNKRILANTDTLHEVVKVTAHDILGLEGYHITIRNLHTQVGKTVWHPKYWDKARLLQNKYKKDQNWRAFYTIKEQWADLRAIHALTCHKAQGSTYEEVFIDMDDISKNNDWREAARMAYVAITRASHKVHIFGQLHSRYINKNLNPMEVFKDAPIFD